MGIENIDELIRNEWLAELLKREHDLVTEFWIKNIRAKDIPSYRHITDEQLREEFPPTVDSMIGAFHTGNIEGPRQHSMVVIRKRLAQGFRLPELQVSLHALEEAVMQIVRKVGDSHEMELEALGSASNLLYMVALIAAEVYEQLREEQQRRFTAAYELGLMLSRILDTNAVLDTAVHKVSEYAHVDAVAIILAKPKGHRHEVVRAYYNLDISMVKAIPSIRKSLGCGTQNAEIPDMRQNARSISDVRMCNIPNKWIKLLTSRGFLSMVCMPLQAKNELLASLVVVRREVHITSDSEMDFLLAMANHIANAMQNARLYEEAQGKRELEILLDASKIFASSLNIQDILKKIARMGSKAIMADLAIVFLPSRGQEHPYHIDYYSTDRKAKDAAQRIMEIAVSGEEKSKHGSLILGLSGLKPMLIEDYADFPRRIQSLVGLIGSGIIVPLKLKDMLLGIFALLSLDQNAFSETDLSLAVSLADLAAVAIENAQLYGYERNISETLQRSFLPTRLPDIVGYEIAAYYRPAMAEAEIGGDFYDAFPSREGSISVIIADVSGKGLDAAVQTAMGKYMIRAYAAEDPSPGSILSRFNRTYYEYGPEGRFMTAFYGMLDPENDTLTYTGAGHDLPLLYSSASDSITKLATNGLCLGIVPETQYVDRQIQFQPGDVLLLYTDGATDINGDSHRLEVSGLQRLFQSSVNMPAEQIIQNVFQGISDYGKGRFTDDIALVVLKRLKNS